MQVDLDLGRQGTLVVRAVEVDLADRVDMAAGPPSPLDVVAVLTEQHACPGALFFFPEPCGGVPLYEWARCSKGRSCWRRPMGSLPVDEGKVSKGMGDQGD